VIVGEAELAADLILLEILEFDAILGMDWLSEDRANLDCFTKEVVFRKPDGVEVVFSGERRILPS